VPAKIMSVTAREIGALSRAGTPGIEGACATAQ